MKKLRVWLRNYFGFSRAETNGFLFILAGMGLALLAPQIVSWLLPPYDPTPDRQYLDSVTALLHVDSSFLENAERNFKRPAYQPKPHLKPTQSFNPNELSAQQWEAFGVPKYVAERIKKYQSKGGSFKTKEDVQRMYGLPEEIYQELQPFIALPTRQEWLAERYGKKQPGQENKWRNKYPGRYPNKYPDKYPRRKYEREILQPFDLNLADTTLLRKVRGIGSKRAAAIVKYRERLGGFTSTAQLSEIFSLDSMARDSLWKYTFVVPGFNPNPLRINSVTLEELRLNPYLKLYQAKAIIAYRDQHGPFGKAEDLLKIKVLKPDIIQKMRPYLSFE